MLGSVPQRDWVFMPKFSFIAELDCDGKVFLAADESQMQQPKSLCRAQRAVDQQKEHSTVKSYRCLAHKDVMTPDRLSVHR